MRVSSKRVYSGPWHDGKMVDIRTSDQSYLLSEYRSLGWVQVRDKLTGKTVERRVDYRMIGNFSPGWICWRGVRLQLTKLLRLNFKEFELLKMTRK